jgi:hypothetical protein
LKIKPVPLKNPVNIDDFVHLTMRMCVGVEKEPVKWAFSQRARGSKSVKLCRDRHPDADVFSKWRRAAQTFAAGQLRESQYEELFVSGEFADAAVAAVTGDILVELVFGQEVEELGEDGATFVHKVKNRQPASEQN